MDDVIGERQTIREEQTVISGYKDQLEDHDTRITKLEESPPWNCWILTGFFSKRLKIQNNWSDGSPSRKLYFEAKIVSRSFGLVMSQSG